MKSKLTSSLISALEEERLPSWDDNGQPNRMQNRYLDIRHKRFDCVSSGFRLLSEQPPCCYGLPVDQPGSALDHLRRDRCAGSDKSFSISNQGDLWSKAIW